MYQVSNQSSKRTEFTIDLIQWGSPQLSEIVITELAIILLKPDVETLLYNAQLISFSSYRKLQVKFVEQFLWRTSPQTTVSPRLLHKQLADLVTDCNQLNAPNRHSVAGGIYICQLYHQCMILSHIQSLSKSYTQICKTTVLSQQADTLMCCVEIEHPSMRDINKKYIDRYWLRVRI